MAMKGLYVDQYREGMRTPAQLNALLGFCKQLQITDLFIQRNWDWGTYYYLNPKKAFNPIPLILANKGAIRVHLWTDLLLVGRDNAYTRKSYDPAWLVWVTPRGGNDERWAYINPAIPAARQFLLTRLKTFFETYPDFDGLHIDRLKFNPKVEVSAGALDLLTAMMTVIRNNTTKFISVPVSLMQDTLQPWKAWLSAGIIDEAMPFLPNRLEDLPDVIDQVKGYRIKNVIVNRTGNLKEIKEALDSAGLGWIYYSYSTAKDLIS